MTDQRREPIFNAPAIVVGLIAVFAAIHLGREFISPRDDIWLISLFSFIPARFGSMADVLPGAPWAGPLSFVSHALIHADVAHLLINSAWLLAVGTPIARRMPMLSFLMYAALSGAGGALLFMIFHPGLTWPLVGASGAISGLMAGVFRLMFAADDADDRHLLRENPAAAPRLSLASTFTKRNSLIAITVWVLVNLGAGFGLGAISGPAHIAWEAHLGGFFTGLLTMELFDRGCPAERVA